MNSTNNRRNHDFQIAYFIVGGCHTADAAWSILSDLLEERNNAITMAEANKVRVTAKQLRIDTVINDLESTKADELDAMADLLEIKAMSNTMNKNIDAAIAERNFIQKCIDKVNPYRKFSHLPDDLAHEAAQSEEWELELMERVELSLFTDGRINSELLSTIRKHPNFETSILPQLNKLNDFYSKLTNRATLINEMSKILPKKNYELPDITELFPLTVADTPKKDISVINVISTNNVVILKPNN